MCANDVDLSCVCTLSFLSSVEQWSDLRSQILQHTHDDPVGHLWILLAKITEAFLNQIYRFEVASIDVCRCNLELDEEQLSPPLSKSALRSPQQELYPPWLALNPLTSAVKTGQLVLSNP